MATKADTQIQAQANAYRTKLAELTDSIVSSSATEAKKALEEFYRLYGSISINVLHDALQNAIIRYEKARSKASAYSREVLKEQYRVSSEDKFLRNATNAFRDLKFWSITSLRDVSVIFKGDVLFFIEPDRSKDFEVQVESNGMSVLQQYARNKSIDCHFVYCFYQDHFLTEDGCHLDREDIEVLLEGYTGFVLYNDV